MTVVQLVLAIDAASGHLVAYQTIYLLVLLVALWRVRHWFDRTSLAAATVFALFLVLVLMCYGVLGAFLLGAGFAPPVTNLPTAFYFTVVTVSTVGCGDIVPQSHEARRIRSGHCQQGGHAVRRCGSDDRRPDRARRPAGAGGEQARAILALTATIPRMLS